MFLHTFQIKIRMLPKFVVYNTLNFSIKTKTVAWIVETFSRPLLAYTDPKKTYILYIDSYDIACGRALVQTVHCTHVVSTALRRMMNILNRRR